MVTLTFASWNLISGWLIRIDVCAEPLSFVVNFS
jgi:hypothetical protein